MWRMFYELQHFKGKLIQRNLSEIAQNFTKTSASVSLRASVVGFGAIASSSFSDVVQC